jgi:hypothetical protein
MKNNFRLLLIGIVVIAVGVGIFALVFQRKEAPVAIDTGNFPTDTSNSNFIDSSAQSIVDGQELPTAVGQLRTSKITRISAGPVSFGHQSLYKPSITIATTTNGTTSTSTVPAHAEIRYIERLSGNVYSYNTHTRKLTRLNNQTLPGIVQASWTPDGKTVAAQYAGDNNTAETYVFEVENENGYSLESGLLNIDIDGKQLLSTLSTDNGTVGTLSALSGDGVSTAFSSPLTSLLVTFSGNSLLATTKPSLLLDGYAFTVSGGVFTRILGPIKGLMTLASPSGKSILYSGYGTGILTLGVYSTLTRDTLALPLITLADKCVWTKKEDALYCAVPRNFGTGVPDGWLQGAVTFADRIWKIDLTTRLATLVYDPIETNNVELDAVELALDAENLTLTFVDKKSASLWSIELD